MNNREFYQETFSQIQSSRTLSFEDMEQKQRIRRKPKAWPAAAAVVALLMGVSGVCYAAGWFGLRDLVVQEETPLVIPVPESEVGEQSPVVETVDMISLSGYMGSPETLALAEWQAFLDRYDPDRVILEQVGNGPTGATAPYANYYLVYTQEMAEQLEQIANKYGLALHTSMDVLDGEGLADRVGGVFLGEEHGKYAGYIYENGTFSTDGDAVLEGHGSLSYQLRREVKGTLGDVMLNITDVDQYDSWQYETACGEWVMLALGPHKALIFADFPTCFITVNVLAGTETPMGDIFSDAPLDRDALEALADGIDFSVLKTP